MCSWGLWGKIGSSYLFCVILGLLDPQIILICMLQVLEFAHPHPSISKHIKRCMGASVLSLNWGGFDFSLFTFKFDLIICYDVCLSLAFKTGLGAHSNPSLHSGTPGGTHFTGSLQIFWWVLDHFQIFQAYRWTEHFDLFFLFLSIFFFLFLSILLPLLVYLLLLLLVRRSWPFFSKIIIKSIRKQNHTHLILVLKMNPQIIFECIKD